MLFEQFQGALNPFQHLLTLNLSMLVAVQQGVTKLIFELKPLNTKIRSALTGYTVAMESYYA